MKKLKLKLKMIWLIFTHENNLLLSFEYSKEKEDLIYVADTDFKPNSQRHILNLVSKDLGLQEPNRKKIFSTKKLNLNV